jgi:tetratricopeptide (TPR) repeat protein
MHQLWGADTTGYHLVNIVLHAISAWLVAIILRRLEVPGAVLAAVIFALHPVHVESVAWMSELKNTLSGVLYLTAMLLYLRFDTARQRDLYAVALGAFVLALLSKTVVASLPAALLLIFWWKRGRLRLREDVVPLVPFFALGLAGGLLTAWVEQTMVGASGDDFDLTVIERVLVAGRALWFYCSKLVWPADLLFWYPRWLVSQGVWWQYLFPIAALMVLAAFWSARRRTRAPLAAALFFGGTLFPALGFLNVYPFRFSFVADHFQYLASLGVMTGLAAGAAVLLRRRGQARAITAVTMAIGVVLGVLTWRQAHHYADAETLYRATLEKHPDSWLAHNHLGALLLQQPDADLNEAIAHVEAALRMSPGSESHNNLGLARYRQGRFDEAVRQHREAIRLKPTLAEAHYNLGLSLAALGRHAEAIAAYREAIRLHSANAEARHNLANALLNVGHLDEAREQLEIAAALSPESPPIRQNLADTLQRLGRVDEAIAHYQAAIRLDPGSAEIYNNMGVALRRANRLEEAAAAFRESARLAPNVAMVFTNLGSALEALGRPAEAIGPYQQALALQPESATAQQNLARARAAMKR